MIARPCSIR
ncbi:hypothetical protein F383_35410 [Gossypium arboreum]|uniref:Uncharacterized protein n=1 Tax=Gossypium arboreum TaxID=29729 RepID=A0A0B0N9E8_GOSAR|nr:hypothetical protein F383_35410 [Gossypium arboreum]